MFGLLSCPTSKKYLSQDINNTQILQIAIMEFKQPHGNGNPYPDQIMPFVPKGLLGIIPFHRIVNRGWVTGNGFIGENQNFTTQWVECFYPVSGTYATTPRFIYYIFLLGAFMPDCLIVCLEYIEYRTANKKKESGWRT